MDLVAQSVTDQQVARAIESTVAELGFELVRVRVRGSRHTTVQVMAERSDGSMSIDDCAALSRAIDSVLDESEPVAGSYELEVSSPGLDRPLTRPRDFDEYRGREVKVTVTELVCGRKRFRGQLLGLRERGEAVRHIALSDPELGEIAIPLSALVTVHLTLDNATLRGALAQKTRQMENK